MIPSDVIQNTNNTYKNLTIHVDGQSFINCLFENCVLEFSGTGYLEFQSNKLVNTRWAFVGPAGNTIGFLAALYGGLGTEGVEVVERLFDEIRNKGKAFHINTPASSEAQDTTVPTPKTP
jgi:hypothetical protein